MSKQTSPGVIESPNLKDGRVRYDVRLADGTLLVVSRRLIVPEPAEPLPAGTRLLVEHNGPSVIGALLAEGTRREAPQLHTPSPPQPQQGICRARVIAADQLSGKLSVTWDEGEELRVTVSPGRQIWRYLRPGAEILVEQSVNASGATKYRLRLPPAAMIGEPGPPAVVGRRAQTAQRAQAPQPAARRGLPPPLQPLDLAPAPHRATGPDAALDRPIACPEMAPIFGAGGPVHRLLGERYSPRPGQIQMAEQIGALLRAPGHAVIEAGTGIGKSFAYLIPIIWSGARAVVSTSNKALMSQLWHKDLPALAQIAPRPFKAALLKGRSNYLCALRLRDLGPHGRRLPGLAGDAELIAAGLARAPSGDCTEMRLPTALIQRVTVDHRACEGRKCPEFGACFYERAKEAAEEAAIVVTNHALLCVSVLQQENATLPLRPMLVIDEAHELEGYAVNALTRTLEYNTLPGIINHPIARDAADNELRRQAAGSNESFFKSVLAQRPNRQNARWALRDEIQEGLRLWAALDRFRGKLENCSVQKAAEGQWEALRRHTEDVLATVHALANPEPPTAIRVSEFSADADWNDASALRIQYRPLEVAEQLQHGLFTAWPRIISTSATLSIAGDLGWYQRRIGAQGDGRTVVTRRIASPFNYPAQVLVYTPRGLAPAYQGAAAERYVEQLSAEVQRLIEASRGRAFVLCTSRARMQQLHERLGPALPYLCLCQGAGASRRELVERFETDGHAVLFGTRSFWEGVDIPGEALSLVILDKVPFLPIDDPVLVRQEALVAARGGNPFDELQLGQAILTLRQGAGRLVRAENDRGVIALLDSRIHDKLYGGKIVRSLPNGRFTARFEDVQAFFAGGQP